jgi:hypothetical protein
METSRNELTAVGLERKLAPMETATSNSPKATARVSYSDDDSGESISVAFEPVGNTTTSPKRETGTVSHTLTWDPWNRLMSVSSGTTPVAFYAFPFKPNDTLELDANK